MGKGCLIVNEHLRGAQKNLSIQEVNLKDSQISVRDDVDLASLDRKETLAQVIRVVTETQETSFTDSQANEMWGYRFVYTSGVRLILSEEEEASKDKSYTPVVEIVGVFLAKYLSHKQLGEEELKAFCEDSVGYHVWPYWREYVQSTCGRIGFSPAFEVPVYFMPQHKN